MLTYRLPIDVATLDLVSPLPVRKLTVSISRGAAPMRSGPGLARVASNDPELARYRRYAAQELAPDSLLALHFVNDRLDARQRFAVLALVLVSGGAALSWVWRSGRSAA